MANVNTTYARLTSVSTSGTTETAFLSAGVVNTDFKGGLTLAANSMTAGDIIRVNAWGWTITGGAGDFGQVRLYLNKGGTLGLVADSGGNSAVPGSPIYEWSFSALITIRLTGASGSGVCDAFFQTLQAGLTPAPTNFNQNSGRQNAFTINTTNATTIELTGTAISGGGLTLAQCSIEYLPSP
jgi:hypothetical protein